MSENSIYLSQLWRHYQHLVSTGQGAGLKHPKMPGQAPTTKNHLAQNADSVKFEKKKMLDKEKPSQN